MAVADGMKSGGLIGGVSARPTRIRPFLHDHPAPVREGLHQLLQEMDAARRAPVEFRRKGTEEGTPPKTCLDRPAFVRELGRIASFVERYAVPAGIIYLQVDRLDAIAERHGADAVSAVLSRVADLLAAQVRETDVVGRLDDTSFGILLAKATRAEASAKADMLGELVKASPLVWNGRAIQLSVTAGAEAIPGT